MGKKALKKLFVVDDDPDILVLVKHCLGKLPDIESKCLSSGEAAIQEALISPPDLLLIDVMMPEMDGIATLKAIKLLPTLSQIPIIFFTAKIQNDEVLEYYKLGVAGVITKPFDVQLFVPTIEQIWDKIQSTS